jgi:Flp pilus assembly protein TadD
MLWATWHIMMQTYGLMRIYDLKLGIRDRVTSRLDFGICLSVFAVGILFSQTRVFTILELAGKVGLPVPPAAALVGLRWTLGAICGLLLIAQAVNTIGHARGRGFSWQKLALLLMTGWLYWSCGSLSTNLLVGVAMFEIFHAVQYDTLVWGYNQRLAQRGSRPGILRFLFANGWPSLAFYVLAIAAFGSVKWAAESIAPSAAKSALLVLLLTSTALHFYFDGFIWKVSERATQQNLGIVGAGRPRTYVPGLVHTAKWGAVAALILLLAWIEFSRPTGRAYDDEAWVDRALTWTPDVPELLVKSGQTRLARGDLTSALDAARRAAQVRPSSAEGESLLADVLAASHDFSGARLAAERAVVLDSTSAGAWYQIGLSCIQLHDFPAAERALQHSIALNPNSAETHFQLGNVYFSTDRTGLAEQSYRRTISLAPLLARGHSNLGAALLQLGRVGEAKQSLLAALELGENPQCHYNLGLILLMEGDALGASSHLQRAESLGQSIPPEIRRAAGL